MTRHLRIGQLAARQGINPKTIRYYEELGLLPPPARSSRGYRLYGERDRERLEFIWKAKAVGLALTDIREVLTLRDAGTEPCGHVVHLLDQKLASVDAQLHALSAFRQELSTLRARASEAPKNAECICGIIEQGVVTLVPRLVTKRQPPRRIATSRS